MNKLLLIPLLLTANSTNTVKQENPVTVIEPVLTYTSDSVVKEGIYLDPYLNENDIMCLDIVVDLDSGYEIYDDEETDYIDGLKINNEWATSYTIVNYDYTQPLEVFVRIVYEDSILGDLASMKDGTYDYTQLISNPIILFQIIYYALAIISVLGALIGLGTSKNKKVKSADDIAHKVKEAAIKAQNDTSEKLLGLIQDVFIPALNKIDEKQQNIVKAITLANSKAQNAPIALLDVLKECSTDTCAEDIEKVKQELLKHLESKQNSTTQILDALTEITTDDKKQEEKSSGRY